MPRGTLIVVSQNHGGYAAAIGMVAASGTGIRNRSSLNTKVGWTKGGGMEQFRVSSTLIPSIRANGDGHIPILIGRWLF